MDNYFVWNVDPNIFQWGALQLRWYGLLFVSSFFIVMALVKWMFGR
jgi:prolipoprotein diacylglyceryltransferase